MSHKRTSPRARAHKQSVDIFRRTMERFVDSSRSEESGALWPMVRLVRMRSSRWVWSALLGAVVGLAKEGGRVGAPDSCHTR